MQTENQTEQPIHFGHFGLILSVAVLLLGITWMKQPQFFSVFQSQSAKDGVATNLPRYYAYEPPAELSQPLVAGASTQGQGPMIINEDGSLSPAVEPGDVLGMSTEDVNLHTESVPVNSVTDSKENIKTYVAKAQEIESNYLDSAQFESALSSNNQGQIDAQAARIQTIIDGLKQLPVPASLVKFHQIKLVQYGAAYEILKRFTKADDNPEMVNSNLSVFLKAEQDLQDEAEKINKVLNFNDYAASPQ